MKVLSGTGPGGRGAAADAEIEHFRALVPDER